MKIDWPVSAGKDLWTFSINLIKSNQEQNCIKLYCVVKA